MSAVFGFGGSTDSLASNVASNVASHSLAEGGGGSVLPEWRENLAILAANRTKGDEGVLTKIGDRLWAERNEVAAAQVRRQLHAKPRLIASWITPILLLDCLLEVWLLPNVLGR